MLRVSASRFGFEETRGIASQLEIIPYPSFGFEETRGIASQLEIIPYPSFGFEETRGIASLLEVNFDKLIGGKGQSLMVAH